MYPDGTRIPESQSGRSLPEYAYKCVKQSNVSIYTVGQSNQIVVTGMRESFHIFIQISYSTGVYVHMLLSTRAKASIGHATFGPLARVYVHKIMGNLLSCPTIPIFYNITQKNVILECRVLSTSADFVNNY